MTINGLITNLLPFLHADSTANLSFWTVPQLQRYASTALKNVAQKFGIFVERNIFQTLVQGTPTYPAPPRHLSTLHAAILETSRPLVASSTKEQEARSDAFQTTQATATNPIRWFYSDKISANRIGVVPLPAAGDAGRHLEVIFHQFPCVDIDDADEDLGIPLWLADMMEFAVLQKSYENESDATVPETGKSAGAMVGLYESAIQGYWQSAQ